MATKNKTFIIGILLLFLLPFAFAETTVTDEIDNVYKQGQPVFIKVPCISNNSYCTAAFECNLTVINPDTSTLLNNVPMTRQTAFYNYTLDTTNTTTIGNYKIQIICTDGINKGYDFGEFQITSSGMSGIGGETLVPAVILIAILLYCLFMSYSLHDDPLRLLFIFFSLFMILIMIQFANLATNGDNVGLTSLLNVLYYVLLPVIFFISVYFIIVKFLMPAMKKLNNNYRERREGRDDEQPGQP